MRLVAMTAAVVLAVACGAAEAAPLAKTLFGAKQAGSAQMPAPMGSYAKGCLAGGVQMPASGPGWHFVRLSRNRNWGHPEAFAFLTRLAAAGQAAGGSTLLVGAPTATAFGVPSAGTAYVFEQSPGLSTSASMVTLNTTYVATSTPSVVFTPHTMVVGEAATSP